MSGLVARIPVSDATAIVDAADAERVSRHRWYLQRQGHLLYAINAKGVYLHRFIIRARSGTTIDHVNGNGLDNQRHNLRVASRGDQVHNTRKRAGPASSRYKGVGFHHRPGRTRPWRARIKCDGREIGLGYFESEVAAAKAYDAAAVRLYGSFACLNFPGNVATRTAIL